MRYYLINKGRHMGSLWIRKIKRLAIADLSPFYGGIFNSYTLTISSTIPTVALFRGNIILNPFFVSTLTRSQWASVVKHEINHYLVDSRR